MIANSDTRPVSRRRALGVLSTTLVGSGAGCLSGSSSLDRDISLAFLRLVNRSREHERTFKPTLSYDGEVIVDRNYEGVPPARAPMNILITTGGRLHYGALPGGTGVDTDRWEDQLVEVHTIILENRNQIDDYKLDIQVSPPDITEKLNLWKEIDRVEDTQRQIKDGSFVGISVVAGGYSIDYNLYTYESGEEKTLLEEYLDAEQTRQEDRGEFGEETVEDSMYT
jgi:hypothetical protein